MLEYWYKEKRTLVDFRRGPLGPYIDGFAARSERKGLFKYARGKEILGKSCLFNSFLIDEGIIDCKEITPSHISRIFLDV